MLAYLVQSLAWSGLGLMAGAALGQIGLDITSTCRHSGRHHNDHT